MSYLLVIVILFGFRKKKDPNFFPKFKFVDFIKMMENSGFNRQPEQNPVKLIL